MIRHLAATVLCTIGIASVAHAQDNPVRDALMQLHAYDSTLPLNVTFVQRADSAAFVREKLVFDGWRGSRVPALVAMPKTPARQHPLVILIDGIGGWKERWWSSTS